MGKFLQIGNLHLDLLDDCPDKLLYLRTLHDAQSHKGLSKGLPDGVAGVQRGFTVLKHHLNVSSHLTKLALLHPEDVSPLEMDLSCGRV